MTAARATPDDAIEVADDRATIRPDVVAVVAATVAWWVAVLIVDPRGEFPINDDWGYVVPVRALVEHGALRFADWQSMPLLTQALWGAAFAAPGGFSFTALRFSTLVLAWVGLVSTHVLLRLVGASPRWAAIGAAALAFQPVYFSLAFSFMTDVPFVALLIAATAVRIHADRTDRAGLRIVATVFGILAVLDRQIGLAFPLAWVVADALRYGFDRRWWLRGVVPLVVTVAVLVVFERIVASTIGLPGLYRTKSDELLQALAGLVRLRGLRIPIERSFITVVYLGVFALPSVIAVASASSSARRRASILLTLVAFSVGLGLAAIGRGMPLTGNVWVGIGIGPHTMAGTVPDAPAILWALITGIGVAAGGWLVLVLVRGLVARLRDRAAPDRALVVALWLTAVAGLAPTAVAYAPFFDRYLLAQLPFVLALLAIELGDAKVRRGVELLAVGLVAVAAIYSIASTHDYLAWQRARWDSVDRAAARGIDRTAIDGGFEVNNHPAAGGPPAVRDDAPYRLATSELDDHVVIDRVPVDAWLPWSIDRVYVLRAL